MHLFTAIKFAQSSCLCEVFVGSSYRYSFYAADSKVHKIVKTVLVKEHGSNILSSTL